MHPGRSHGAERGSTCATSHAKRIVALLLFIAACSPVVPDRGPAASSGAPQPPHEAPVTTSERADAGASPSAGRPAGDLRAHGPGASGLAVTLLATLAIRAHDPRRAYARDAYGAPWADVDRNHCDTRNDVLRRDLSDVRFKHGTRDCVVLSGTLADPYTGAVIAFERGDTAGVDVDHVVPLSNAWVTGAAAWPTEQRVALANDPLNLLAVEARANRAKGDSDAAAWLPPAVAYHCAYVARQVAVKAKYGLWVTPAEHAALLRVLRTCPEERSPTGDAPIFAPVDSPALPIAVQDTPRRGATDESLAPRTRTPDPDYGSCKQAKANHAGPYVRGQDPEYAYYDDRDRDGVVCE